MANSADSDSETNWSGSTLFAKAGYIWLQQDKGCPNTLGKYGKQERPWPADTIMQFS